MFNHDDEDTHMFRKRTTACYRGEWKNYVILKVVMMVVACVMLLMTAIPKGDLMVEGNEASYSYRSYRIAGMNTLPENRTTSDMYVKPDAFTLFLDHVSRILYFVEQNRIRKITLSTGVIVTVVGNGESGLKWTNDPFTTQVSSPKSFQIWKGNLIWIDGVCRIRMLNSQTNQVETIFGVDPPNDSYGNSNGSVTNPLQVLTLGIDSLSVNPKTNDIFITDGYNFRLRKIDGITGLASIFIGESNLFGISSNVSLSSARFGSISNVLHCSGELFVSTNYGTIYNQKIFNNYGELWVETSTTNFVPLVGCYNGTYYSLVNQQYYIWRNGYWSNLLMSNQKGETPDGEITISSLFGNINNLVVDNSNGDIYFVEWNYNIRKLSGTTLSTISHYNSIYNADPLNFPFSIKKMVPSRDRSGWYILESNAIKFFNFTTFKIQHFAGIPYFESSDVLPQFYVNSTFSYIYDIATSDENANVYIIIYKKILLLESSGELSIIAGTVNNGGVCQDGSVATNCYINTYNPTSIHVYQGQIYYSTSEGIFYINNGTIHSILMDRLIRTVFIKPSDGKIYYNPLTNNQREVYIWDPITKSTTAIEGSEHVALILCVDDNGKMYYEQESSINAGLSELFTPTIGSSIGLYSNFSGSLYGGSYADTEALTNTKFNQITTMTCNNEVHDSFFISDKNQIRKTYITVDYCFGIISNSSTVCNGHGKCTAPNSCTCNYGYYGTQCQLTYPVCFSLMYPNACSKHGNCTNKDRCECYSGYYGKQCEYPSCFGVISTDPTVCNGRGKCSDIDICQCFKRYSGETCQTTASPVFLDDSNGYRSVLLGGIYSYTMPENITTSQAYMRVESNNLLIDGTAKLLYFVYQNRIKKINLLTDMISTVVGNGKLGSWTTNPLTTQLQQPKNLQLWKGDLIWIEGGKLRKLDHLANNITLLFGNILDGFQSVSVDPVTSDLYFISNFAGRELRKIDGITGSESVITNLAGLKDSGIVIVCGDGVFISNYNIVWKISLPDKVITTILYNNYQDDINKIISLECFNNEIYFAKQGIIQKISVTGILNVIGNNENILQTPDGLLLNSSYVNIKSNAFSIDKTNGDIYFKEGWNFRKVSQNKILSTIYRYPIYDNRDPRTDGLDIYFINHISPLADGSGLIISDQYSFKIIKYSTFALETHQYFPNTTAYTLSLSNLNTFDEISETFSAPNGDIYIATFYTIQLLFNSGRSIHLVGSLNKNDKNCDDGDDPTKCTLYPRGLQMFNGELYFFCFSKIYKLDSNGKIKVIVSEILGILSFYIRPTDGKIYFAVYATFKMFDPISGSVITIFELPDDFINIFSIFVDDYGKIFFSTFSSVWVFVPSTSNSITGSLLPFAGYPHSVGNDVGMLNQTNLDGVVKFFYIPNKNSIVVADYQSIKLLYPINPKSASSSFTTCFGVSSLDNTVCSYNGDCIGNNLCQCFKGFYGERCNISTCFGTRQDDSKVCSGKGRCLSDGKCSCQSGYSGLECELKTCFGIPSSDSTVCNGRGNCTDFDTCQCYSIDGVKITGDACENLLCKGVFNEVEDYYSHSDARVCSRHGKCSFNSTTFKGGCSCEYGYYGERCDQFNCYLIAKNNVNVCSGHGICADIDTCQCYGDASNGHYFGSSCNSCHPAFAGASCKEKACTVSTCLNGGSCGSENQCVCSGNFNGTICDKCASDHFGVNCDLYCNDKVTCSGQGICNSNALCDCYSDREHGFWNGSNCNSCLFGYYGSECMTYFASFDYLTDSPVETTIYGQVSKYFDGISFKLFGPSSYISNIVSCSKLIHPEDISMFGTESKCYWTDKSNGQFNIEFDSDFNFDISLPSFIRLNTNIFSKSSTQDYLKLYPKLSDNIASPTANIKSAKKDYSTSENVYLSGANSFSGDKKGLIYYWDISGQSISDSVLKQVTANKESTMKIERGQLTSGIYTIYLYVKSQVSKLASYTESFTFQVQDVEFPSVVIVGAKEISVKSTDKLITIKKTTAIPSSLKDREFTIEWQQTEGPLIKFKKDSYNNLLIEQFNSGKWKYVFKVSISVVDNPILTSSDYITIATEQPKLVLSLTIMKQVSPFTSNISSIPIQVNFQDPESNTDEKEVWRWTCIDSETEGYCGDLISQKLSLHSKNRSISISFSQQDFSSSMKKPTLTLNIIKGERSVSGSLTLNIVHSPPLITIINISPKSSIVNSNDKISIEIKHQEEDPTDTALSVNTQWKIDNTLVSESETIRTSNEFQTTNNLPTTTLFKNLKFINKNQQSSIIVDSKELDDGIAHSIQVKVSFVNPNSKQIISSSEITNRFTKASSPKKCPCKISPSSGVSMKTDFTFTCENCQNEYNTIEVKQGYIDKETGIKVFLPLSQDSTVKIPSLSSNGNVRRLSNGQTQTNTVTLFIELKDIQSGESRIMYSNITVTPDSASSLSELANRVSNQTNNIMTTSIKDGDTSGSIADTINTIVSTSQLIQTLPTAEKDTNIISSVQSKLLDTLSSSLQTGSEESISASTSSMAVLAVHSMVKNEDTISKPVIEKSITVLNHVVRLTLKSKVDIFAQTAKPLTAVIGTLSSQVFKLSNLKEQFSKYEDISVLAEDYTLSYANSQSVSADPASFHESVANVKADKMYLIDFAESLITSAPVDRRGYSYQAFVTIPPMKVSESNEYAELTYSIVMKEHVPDIYQKVIGLDNNSTIVIVSPIGASFSLSSPHLKYMEDLSSQNVTIHINVIDADFSESELLEYSCLLIKSDLQAYTENCTAIGRDKATTSIACNCKLEDLKVSNLIIAKDKSRKKHPTPPLIDFLLGDDALIAISVVVSIVGVIFIILSIIVLIVACYCCVKKKRKVNPYSTTLEEADPKELSHTIQVPSKLTDTSMVSTINPSNTSISLL